MMPYDNIIITGLAVVCYILATVYSYTHATAMYHNYSVHRWVFRNSAIHSAYVLLAIMVQSHDIIIAKLV